MMGSKVNDLGRLADATGLSSAAPIEPVPVSPVPASIPSAALCRECGQSIEELPAKVSFWFMYDCHLFKPLTGTPEEMVETVIDGLRNRSGPESERPFTYGMLCPATISVGKSIRRDVGPAVHTRTASEEDIAKFRQQAQPWIEAMRSNRMTAQAIEAGTAATGTGAVHESAVRQDAPNMTPDPNPPHTKGGLDQ